MEKHSKYLELATLVARDAGKLLRDTYSADAGVECADGKDIKTLADKAAEGVALSALMDTGFQILSEESGVVAGSEEFGPLLPSGKYIWIIDPLDGTFNFVRGYPACCVSIALWNGLEPILGVIYDFVGDKLYSGSVGDGATCNGHPIFVSTVDEITKAALATGFPSARDYSDGAIAASIRSAQQFKKIRMIGSAASSLAHVAVGHFDVYQEEDIWLWDVAAGLALIRAAGGYYKISEIKETWQLDVFASNGLIRPNPV